MSFLSLLDSLQHALTTPLCRECGQRLPLSAKRTTRFCRDCRDQFHPPCPSRTSVIVEETPIPVWQHVSCSMSARIKRKLYDYKFYGQQQNRVLLSDLLIDYWESIQQGLQEKLGVHPEQTTIIVIPPHQEDAPDSPKTKPVHCRLSPIASSFARAYGFDLIKEALIWSRACKPQHTILNRHERLKNLRGGLNLKNSQLSRYQRVIILDDIRTTGATFAEVVRAINTAHPSIEIHTLAVAAVSYRQNLGV